MVQNASILPYRARTVQWPNPSSSSNLKELYLSFCSLAFPGLRGQGRGWSGRIGNIYFRRRVNHWPIDHKARLRVLACGKHACIRHDIHDSSIVYPWRGRNRDEELGKISPDVFQLKHEYLRILEVYICSQFVKALHLVSHFHLHNHDGCKHPKANSHLRRGSLFPFASAIPSPLLHSLPDLRAGQVILFPRTRVQTPSFFRRTRCHRRGPWTRRFPEILGRMWQDWG